MKRFIARLLTTSKRFKHLWELQAVATPRALRKTLQHSSSGLLSFEYATLRPDGVSRDLRITIYTPADARTRAALQTLLAQSA